MTPEVRTKIEQIRNGNVPEGYIKGKDGIHPCDWTAKKMGQWLKLAERPVVLKDDEVYQLVTVRRGFGGVGSRGYYLGKSVLVKNYFSVNAGDFIISKRQIAHGACGVVPEELDGAVVSNEYNVFIPQDDTNIQMFNLMMQLPHYKRLYYLMSDGVHIEKLLFKTQDWMRRSLAMPPLEEQKKIAEILTTQDKVIELVQQKIEEIKKVKKFFLSKMFPKKGHAVPEIRFKGFTDAWEQRKLSDLVSYESSDLTAKDVKELGMFDLYDANGIIGKADGLPIKTEYISIIKDGAGVGRIRKLPANTLIIGTMGALVTNKSDQNFIYSLLTRFNPGEEYTGSTIPHIYFKDYGNNEYYIPKNEEQIAIGNYFRELDNLITLHQRKLEEEKQKKKALMQLLLMGIVRV